jgi:hypothetical protein
MIGQSGLYGYHIDDFRAKLLGFLPLATGAGFSSIASADIGSYEAVRAAHRMLGFRCSGCSFTNMESEMRRPHRMDVKLATGILVIQNTPSLWPYSEPFATGNLSGSAGSMDVFDLHLRVAGQLWMLSSLSLARHSCMTVAQVSPCAMTGQLASVATCQR